MAEKIAFGIHSITPYARKQETFGGITYQKGQPFGQFSVLGDGTFNQNASSVQLFGGSNLYAWANEISQIDGEFVMTIKEIPDFLFFLYSGAVINRTASAALGTITALLNEVGTSVFDAVTGITTATLKTGEEGELKVGHYVTKAASATTVDVYQVTDLNFGTKTTVTSYINEQNKITTSPLTVTTGAPVEIPGYGIELTGGSGAIAFVDDDIAFFDVTPPHGGFSTIDVGQKGVVFPEHGLWVFAKERSSGRLFYMNFYKVQISSGISLPLAEGGYVQTDITVKTLFDDSPNDGGAGRVARITNVDPTS